MKMAELDGSPAMLDALKQFAFSTRGPDSMRYEALSILHREGQIDSGPHRFYSRGTWTDIKLFMPEITWEPTECSTPWVRELIETGTEAIENGDYELAEESFSRILEREPDNYNAAYNLCVIWIERDGWAGRRRARPRLEELHNQFPDYVFARLALAQFAIVEGDFERAIELMDPILGAEKLHVAEATALFETQIQLAIERRRFDAAEQSLAILISIIGEDAPIVIRLRRLIDTSSRKRGLRHWIP